MSQQADSENEPPGDKKRAASGFVQKQAFIRIMSIDALRGFDMLWIIGLDRVFQQIAVVHNTSVTQWLSKQTRHSFVDGMTRGFTFYDLILPLFIFLMGAVIPIALGKRLQDGVSRHRLALRILKRGLILFLLGLVYNGILGLQFEGQRYWSVLGTIGISYAISALLFVYGGLRATTIFGLALLVMTGAIQCCVGAPGFEAGDYTREGNVVGWIDRTILPPWLYPSPLDPGGPFASIVGALNAIMGVLAGATLGAKEISQWRKVMLLSVSGICLLIGGWLLSPILPIMKDLWTSTYALLAGGWSCLLLALSYILFDIFRFRYLAYFFAVVGANAITAYMLYRIVDFYGISVFFFGGISRRLSTAEAGEQLVVLLGVLIVQWLVFYVLYRHRIFLRV